MRLVLVLGGALLLAAGFVGCAGVYTRHGYGENAFYRNPEAGEPVRVSLPANAPSISQQFEPVPAEGDLVDGPHMGIDIFVPTGTPVLAPMAGTVSAVGQSLAYGRTLTLDHGQDDQGRRITTRYLHLNKLLVQQGQQVERGQIMARSGRSGVLGAFPHLHFEVARADEDGQMRRHNPHRFWADGPGKVTCFRHDQHWPDNQVLLTYPVPCR